MMRDKTTELLKMVASTLGWIIVMALVLFFAAELVQADEHTEADRDWTRATLQWVPPTTRIDGKELDPATELKEYRLYCSGQRVAIIQATGENERTFKKSELFSEVGYGRHECAMTAVDTENRESAYSNTVEIPWFEQKPEAPTELIFIAG